MRTTHLALVLLALCASPAAAVDRLPQELVGNWCVDHSALATGPTDKPSAEITMYRRARQCKADEDSLIVRSDRLFIDGEVECKILQILSLTRNEAQHLKFRCRHVNGDTWIFDAWMSVPAPNKLSNSRRSIFKGRNNFGTNVSP
jgi:hypothetical protein